jgi:hypothetical protein
VQSIVDIFSQFEKQISTLLLDKGLTSNGVLIIIRNELVNLGFQVESGTRKAEKIQRPVFFGINGEPTLKYEIDAFHSEWLCGLEVEAGRAWVGNAIYRDLIHPRRSQILIAHWKRSTITSDHTVLQVIASLSFPAT